LRYTNAFIIIIIIIIIITVTNRESDRRTERDKETYEQHKTIMIPKAYYKRTAKIRNSYLTIKEQKRNSEQKKRKE